MEKKLQPSNDKDALIKRLKRIEGQVKGIQNGRRRKVLCRYTSTNISNKICYKQSRINYT